MGEPFKIGDYVTIRLVVTGKRPAFRKANGDVVPEILELGREFAPGVEAVEHFLVCPAEYCQKA
jgi:hypothetical protein